MGKELKNWRFVKTTLLTSGSLIFALVAAVALHECGHAIGFWMDGSGVGRILINPFGGSYTYPASYTSTTTMRMPFWDGPILGSVLGICLSALVWSWRGFKTLWILMTGPVACVFNGMYFLYDFAKQLGGDASKLYSYGTDGAIIITAGVCLTVIGVVLLASLIPLTGIRKTDGLTFRTFVLWNALAWYTLLRIVCRVFLGLGYSSASLIYAMPTFGLLFVVALLSLHMPKSAESVPCSARQSLGWSDVGVANIAAVVIISMLLVVLYQNKVHTGYLLTHYTDPSNFAGIRRTSNPIQEESRQKSYGIRSSIFWRLNGQQIEQVEINDAAFFVTPCIGGDRLVVLATHGVLVVSGTEMSPRWIFQGDKFLLDRRFGVSSDGHNVVIQAIDLESRNYLLVAISTQDARESHFVLPEKNRASEVAFVDDNEAIASLADGAVRILYSGAGEAHFIYENTTEDCQVMGAFHGSLVQVCSAPVSTTDESSEFIRFLNVEVTGISEIRYVVSSNSYVWVINEKKEIWRITASGDKSCLLDYGLAGLRTIGHGTVDDRLWIAFSDGTIRVFGDSEEIAKIELP